MSTQDKVNLYTRYIDMIDRHEREFNAGRVIYRPFPHDSYPAILRRIALRKLTGVR